MPRPERKNTKLWKAAYERCKREWPYILDGRDPPPEDAENGLTIAVLCNEFLNEKRRRMKAGELSRASMQDYLRTTGLLVTHFGKHHRVDDLRPDDFGRSWRSAGGVATLKNEINPTRTARPVRA